MIKKNTWEWQTPAIDLFQVVYVHLNSPKIGTSKPPRQHRKHHRVRPPKRFPPQTSPRRGQCQSPPWSWWFFHRNPYLNLHFITWHLGGGRSKVYCFKKIFGKNAEIYSEILLVFAILDGILLRYFQVPSRKTGLTKGKKKTPGSLGFGGLGDSSVADHVRPFSEFPCIRGMGCRVCFSIEFVFTIWHVCDWNLDAVIFTLKISHMTPIWYL